MAATKSEHPAPSRLASEFVFLLALVALVAYGVSGGAYDVVTRQQAGLIVWVFLGLGIALGAFPRTVPRGAGAVLAAILAVLAAVQLLSATWSESVDRSLVEAARALHYLGIVLLATVCLSRSTWRPAAAGLTAGAAILCLVAVLSRLDPSTSQLAAIASGLPPDRTSFPFDYWNAVGVWGALTGALGLTWGIAAHSRIAQALGLAIVPVAALTAYITYSRTSIGTLAIGALVVLVLGGRPVRTLIQVVVAGGASAGVVLVFRSHPQLVDGTGTAGAGSVALTLAAACAVGAAVGFGTAWLPELRMPLSRQARRGGAVGLGVAVLIVAALFLPPVVDRAWDQFRAPFPESATSAADPSVRLTTLSGTRYQLYVSSWAALESDALRGTGAGTFEFWWTRDGRNPESVRDAHSFVLEAGAELGVPGLILAIALVVGLIAAPLIARFRLRDPLDRSLAAGVVAVAVVWGVAADVDWMWESTAVTVLVLALVGAVAASGLEDGRPVGLARRAPVAVLALLIGALQFPSLMSVSAQRESQVRVRAGELAPALAEARRAERWAPWSADATLQRGFVEQQLGRTAAARKSFETAADREPTNWRIPLSIARLEVQAGRVQRALAALRESRRLHPTAPFLRARD